MLHLNGAAGCSLGPVVAMPLCGWILTTWGWPAVFYVSGTMALIWYAAWLFLVHESPEVHPRISKKEKKYLKDNLEVNYDDKPTSLPWKEVFASSQFWIGIVAHVGSDWGFHIFYTFGPKYMKDALGFDINKVRSIQIIHISFPALNVLSVFVISKYC